MSAALADSSVVFRGEVVRRFPFEDGHRFRVVTVFNVNRVWKGTVSSHFAVIEYDHASCGTGFILGHDYLVLALPAEQGLLPETYCSMRNQEFNDQVASTLGEGRAPIPLWPVPLLFILLTFFLIGRRIRSKASATAK